MEYRILIFTIAVLVYQVQSQICYGTGGQLVTNTPYIASPQILAAPVVATTVVDNSVSNALANALQLLIVSDLIESRLSNVIAPNALLSTLAPVLDRVGPLYSPIVDVISPCPTPIEILPPCVPVIEAICPSYYGGITETLSPNIYGGYTETFYNNPFVTETIIPNYYRTETIASTPCGVTEIISPNYGPNIATLTPNIYGGVTEVFSSGPCVQQLPVNNFYGGYGEIITPGCGPNFYGGLTEIVGPNPFINNCYGGYTEIVSPISSYNPGCIGGVTEIISTNPYGPNFYGGLTEIVSPCSPGCVTEFIGPYGPNYYGGVTEVISPFNTGCIGGINELVNPFGPIYGGITEVIGPYNSGCLGGLTEIITSNAFGPNCYGGMREFLTPTGPFGPVAAEVTFPSAIPAQLTCNFGYMPTSLPCVSVNVDPIPFEPCGCGCNGFPKSFYF